MADCLASVPSPETSTLVDYDCVYKNYQKNIVINLTSVPDYLTFFKNNDACESELLFFDVLRASGYTPNAKKKVSLGDIALIPHVIQYLEMVFSKYDANRDQKLDRFEAEKAFPVFQPLFREFAKGYIKKGLLSEKDLFPLFTFVLKTGKIPGGIGDFVKFMIWKNTPVERRIFTANRNKLASIIGVVADESNKKSPKAEAAPAVEVLQAHFSKQCQPKNSAPQPPGNGLIGGH